MSSGMEVDGVNAGEYDDGEYDKGKEMATGKRAEERLTRMPEAGGSAKKTTTTTSTPAAAPTLLQAISQLALSKEGEEAATVEAEKTRARLLSSRLDSLSMKEYLVLFGHQQERQQISAALAENLILDSPPSLQAKSNRPISSSSSAPEGSSPTVGKKRLRDTTTSTDSSSPSPSPTKQARSPPRLIKAMGRGRGRQGIKMSHNRSYVSQLFELQQAMDWEQPIFGHNREGFPPMERFRVWCLFNGENYRANRATTRLKDGKEKAARQALECILGDQ